MNRSATSSSLQELQRRLAPVRRRLAASAVFRAAARGLWLGATVALWLALLLWIGRELGIWPRTYWILWPGGAACAVVLGVLVGVVAGLRQIPAWLSVAATVDAHFGLRDAVLAAIQFAERAGVAGLRPLEAMQVAQTLRRLDQLDLSAVVRLRLPKSVYGGALSLAAAAALFAWSLWLGPPQERTGETVPQPEAATRTAADTVPVAEPTPPTRKTGEQLRATVEWQVAPRGELRGGGTDWRFEGTLEEAVRAAGADRPAAPTSLTPALAPDRIPPEYGPIVRRYFELERE